MTSFPIILPLNARPNPDSRKEKCPSMNVPQEHEMTSEQYTRLRDLIYQRLGLFFEDSKVYFIKRRIERRITALQLEKVDEYIFYLRFCDETGREMQELANLITTNETYMFREYEQLESFSNYCLPEILEEKRKRGNRSLRIWSAGCSSGEEPYTLAILLREIIANIDEWEVEIVATDIDSNMLEAVEAANYGDRSVKDVPEAYFDRHLIAVPNGFRVRLETKRLVSSRHLNLNDRMSMRAMRGFDFVFCRNVLIYFDDASRKSVVDHFYSALNPGGYIFLGHSESIGRISSAFTLVRRGDFLTYRKL